MTSPLFCWRRLTISLALLGGTSAALAAQAPAPAPAATTAAAPMTEAEAATAAAAAANPFTAHLRISADGTAIIDTRSKLAWARCVEGMFWNGKTCSGQRRLLDRAEATAVAQARAKAEETRWRLPRVNELRRLVDKKANPPGIPPRLFPAAPFGLHWTSTANDKTFANNQYNYGNISQGTGAGAGSRLAALDGWAVDMDTGIASGDVPRSSRLPVRLVRLATEHD